MAWLSWFAFAESKPDSCSSTVHKYVTIQFFITSSDEANFPNARKRWVPSDLRLSAVTHECVWCFNTMVRDIKPHTRTCFASTGLRNKQHTENDVACKPDQHIPVELETQTILDRHNAPAGGIVPPAPRNRFFYYY